MIAVLLAGAFFLTKQMSDHNRIISGQLIKQTGGRNAKLTEMIFNGAFRQLENKSSELSEAHIKEYGRTNSSVIVDKDGDGDLFTSFSIENAKMIFPEKIPDTKNGVITTDDGVKLYTFTSSGHLLLGNMDTERLSFYLKLSGIIDDRANHILYDSETGNIIINSGADDGFDGAAIGFLSTHKYASGYSAQKMFSDIKKGLSGYTVIKNDKGVNYLLYYEPVGMERWYLLQFAPEKVLAENIERSSSPTYVLIAVLAAATLVYTTMLVLASQKASKDKADFLRDSKILKTMVMQMSESSLSTIFVYRRKNDEMDLLRDREVLYPDGKTIKGAISYLEKYFGHSPEDIRRLKNAFVLAVSKQYIKLELESQSVAGVLISEYTMCALKTEDGENDAEIVCTVVERPKIIGSEINTFSEDNVYNTTGIEVLLEANSWRFMWNNEKCFEKLNFGTDFRNNYDDDLEQVISAFIMSKDRPFFLTALSRLNLLENYRNGNTEFKVKYRINTGGGVYEYRVLDIHMYRDGNNDEIKANLYARHIG